MTEFYLIVSTIVLGLMTIIWTRKDWFNAIIKVAFCGLTITGIIVSLISMGFVLAP